jgi:molybdopterin-guanine dinucleotide biosynthesis protein A
MKFDTAVIFAGGKSSRMKQDKALLPFGGYNTLTEYQYQRLSKIFNRVYISAKSNKFDFNADMIFDKNTQIFSPLIGIISIFETLDLDEVFIISVDIPFISEEIIQKLYKNSSIEHDIVVAKSKNGIEPLCGIYRRDVLEVAKANLENNIHKLKALLNSLNTKVVDFNLKDEFLNLNTPQIYNSSLNLFR